MQLANSYRAKEESEKHIALLKKAADNGMVPALCNLASIYMSGKIVPRDEALAMQYADKALATKSPMAATFMGAAFAFGRWGFPVEEQKGRAYLEAAAAAGIPQAQKMLQKLNNK